MQNGHWRGGGASLCGTRHARLGAPCQDVHRYVSLEGGSVLIAVADGAGSAENALEGAELAINHIITALTEIVAEGPTDEETWHTRMREAFDRTHTALRAQASEEKPLRSFATTLTCVVLHGGWSVAGQIGDGVIVVETLDGTLVTAMRPRRGEYATDTYFLTMPDPVQYLDVWISHEPIIAVAVTTDGFARLIMRLSDYTPHGPFFRPLLDTLRHVDEDTIGTHLTALLNSERVRNGTDDDTTLVLALRDALPLDAPAETLEGPSLL